METNEKYLSNGEVFKVLFDSMNRTKDKELLNKEKASLEYMLNLPYEDIEKFFTNQAYYDEFLKDESRKGRASNLNMFGCFVLNGYLLGYKQGIEEALIDEMVALSKLEDKESTSL